MSNLVDVVNASTDEKLAAQLKNTRVSSFRQLDECLKKIGAERDDQMIRNNVYIAPLEWFYIEPGFNLRGIDEAHADGFAVSYKRGHYVPPVVAELKIIDGVPRLVLREGHHRIIGAHKAQADGANLPGLQVNEFKGNSSDAVLMMIKTSEGKPLRPLERAEGYKRLAGQNWSTSQIAEDLNRSITHVERLLLLANAEENVKQLVRDDLVKATTVMDVLVELRGTGQDPYPKLLQMIESAKAQGRKHATGKDASKALGKFKVTPKEATAAFGALSGLTGSLREQVAAGREEVELNLRLDAKKAELMLKLLEKYESTQSEPEGQATTA